MTIPSSPDGWMSPLVRLPGKEKKGRGMPVAA